MAGFCRFRNFSKICKESVTLLSYSKQMHLRRLHISSVVNKTDTKESPEVKLPQVLSNKYEVFRDDPSPIILDIEEERKVIEQKFGTAAEEEEEIDEFYGISPERGTTGVIDIEEAVQVLKLEKAKEIVVLQIPPEYNYVNYFIIVTGKSKRHMTAMAEYMRRVYKYKRYQSDIMPRIEGEDSSDWIALDLGNIALHIFSPKGREKFDLECLWAVGSKHDPKCNERPTEVELLFSENTYLLSNFKPAESKK